MRPSAVTPLLEARALVKRFAPARPFGGAAQRVAAVDGVDLVIARGEAVGLVGPSGSGKTTLARLLARLIEPDSGDLLLDGRSLLGRTPAAFARAPERRRVQMSFQDPADSLAPHLAAGEAIADPLRALAPRASAAERRARAIRAAERAGLGLDLLDRRPHQLSDGQKARVGLARAMAPEPDLLILDEPTAALDAMTAAGLLRTLGALKRESGLALLLVSHDADAVRLVCDRTATMTRGRLAPA
ncbi:MAG: ABC transporter ATP-binding protein [Rhizobiales bacterium]|nr:ABC transporter ATP-binding protein [Hyphomicrobiales bacterium]